ncbi:MAG: hypothetical protein FJ304_25740 [Planctomycetes bacterium]|nr:hypothetical protein [Planctomycetota bacterium]
MPNGEVLGEPPVDERHAPTVRAAPDQPHVDHPGQQARAFVGVGTDLRDRPRVVHFQTAAVAQDRETEC